MTPDEMIRHLRHYECPYGDDIADEIIRLRALADDLAAVVEACYCRKNEVDAERVLARWREARQQ